MARGANQKLKLLYLMKILLEKTDDRHCMTMAEILAALQGYGITAERKSIYADMEALRLYGLDIIGENSGSQNVFAYHIGSRQFELAELKLLVDSVQSSKFITARKSRELVHKLEQFASEYEAKELQRQVYVSGRIKNMNESIYYNVDLLHQAITQDVRVRFHYFQWNERKEMELRHGGKYYYISPWSLLWDAENYYLVGFDDEADKIKHYRVDRMLRLSITEEKRAGAEYFAQFDMAAYTTKVFRMFAGTEEAVTLRFQKHLAGVVIDHFGKEVPFYSVDEDHFDIHVNVAVSGQFFGWLFALGDGVELLSPDTVREQLRQELQRLQQLYVEKRED
ncbi:MAG: WYL domain-containing protein [Clostridium sp.]|nr:WYL domain-containing protein [Clostridium sp.]